MNRRFGFLILSLAICTGVIAQESDTWYNFIYTDGGFSIDFPKEPTPNPQMINTEAGRMKVEMFQVDASQDAGASNVFFAVNYTAFPDSLIQTMNSIEDFYANSIGGMVGNVHEKLLSEQIIDFGDYEGRYIRIDFRMGWP